MNGRDGRTPRTGEAGSRKLEAVGECSSIPRFRVGDSQHCPYNRLFTPLPENDPSEIRQLYSTRVDDHQDDHDDTV